jgi:SAM-dependent methyltransferase
VTELQTTRPKILSGSTTVAKPYSRYDRIGTVYTRHRAADPRIARQIHAALGDARRVLNVGAGTGSYEPSDREVFAIEPSVTMIAQRPAGSAPVVRGVAEHLPFLTQSFNASMALLTLHHWSDKALGLAELRRVAPRRVVLCFDAAREHTFWLVREYLPEISTLDGSTMSPEEVADAVDASRIESVGVPWDCTDGFLGAHWRRPESYLDPSVRACISGIARLHPEVVARGIGRLRRDLQTGAWARRHADLLHIKELDIGYRLVVSG